MPLRVDTWVGLFLVGAGATLLVGTVVYCVEVWYLFRRRTDAYWLAGMGAGMLASGWALLKQPRSGGRD